jgi:hypothetical protein
LLFVPAAQANLVQNGDFNAGLANWTYWNAPWGTVNVDDAGCPNPGNPEPSAHHSTGGGSGGLYQLVPVPTGVPLTLDADWTGDVSCPGWAEVIMDDWAGGDPVAFMDGPAGPHVRAKKDGWGLNPPAQWDWETIQNSPSGGPFTIVSATGTLIVGTKLGSNPGNQWLCVDNISIVPEPATVALLGLGSLGLLRRRRR